MKANSSSIVIIDSIDSLVPESIINSGYTDANMGKHARLMSNMCRRFTPIASNHNILIFYINQVREKIGMSFGDGLYTPGGRALKFYCSARLKITSSQIKKGDSADLTQRNVTVNAVKHSFGVPYRKTSLNLKLGVGFDKGIDLVNNGLRTGELEMSGSWVCRDGKNIAQGKDKAAKFLIEELEKVE